MCIICIPLVTALHGQLKIVELINSWEMCQMPEIWCQIDIFVFGFAGGIWKGVFEKIKAHCQLKW